MVKIRAIANRLLVKLEEDKKPNGGEAVELLEVEEQTDLDVCEKCGLMRYQHRVMGTGRWVCPGKSAKCSNCKKVVHFNYSWKFNPHEYMKRITKFYCMTCRTVEGHRMEYIPMVETCDVCELDSDFSVQSDKAFLPAICCDICNHWYHHSCLNLSTEEVKLYEKKKYECPSCKK